MDAARLLQMLPVEAAHQSSRSKQATTTTTTATATATTATITTKPPQIYMLNIENENNQLRNNYNNNSHSFQDQTTVKSSLISSTLNSISQLISSMLQATNNNNDNNNQTTTSTITTLTTTTTAYNSNNSLPLISNFSTIDLLIVTVLITLILVSIIGNCLVCVAIFTDRRLRKLGNAFIVSLAIADLFVSCLVMTFALCNDLMNYWIFGDWFCDVWISFDIMCCTASILNLCAISLDRFIHIKDCLFYNQWMTKKVAISAVIIIWFISALVSFVPINLGWHKPDYRFGGGGSSMVASSSSVSSSSVVSVGREASLSVSGHHHHHHQQEQRARYRRRAPNQQTTFDANFQLQHPMSIPSGTSITSNSFEKQAIANNRLLEEAIATATATTSQQGAKLNYLSKHVEFNFNSANDNNREQTTTATTTPIESIENQSSPYLTTTEQSLGSRNLQQLQATALIAKRASGSQLSHQDLSARFNRNGFLSQIIINRRRQRDLVSSYNNHYKQERWQKEDGLDPSVQVSSSLRPEIDSSGSTATTTTTTTSTTANKSKPSPEDSLTQPLPSQSNRPQSNKVESNPLDRSQIELDPPKAWLFELEREAARKAIPSSSSPPSTSSSSTSRRQVNLAPSPSAALKLSRLPELTDEDETTIMPTVNHNSNVDLISKQQQESIIQDQNHNQDQTESDRVTGASPLLEVNSNNNSDNSNNPQLPLCILTLTPTYAVISSTISFYIPCIIMLGLYTKLFACARKHVRNIQAITKAPAPISVRATNATTTTTTTTNTSQRSSPGTSDAAAQQQFENNNNDNNKGRCGGQQGQRGRHRRLHKIAMLECGSLPNPSPMRTWLKFGRKQQRQQQQEEVGEKLNEKYSNAQLYDKSRSKNTIFSNKNGAEELVVSNEVLPGNELVELARFKATANKEIKQQQQLTETSRKPDNDLGLSEVLNNDHQQQRSSSSSAQQHQCRKHCNALEDTTARHGEVARRMQMPQLDSHKHYRQVPEEKNGKNNSRKSLIGSENERIAAFISAGGGARVEDEASVVVGAGTAEEQLPFLASPQEINNRTRPSKQVNNPRLPLNVAGNPTTKMINFSKQTNFQQQQQQQQQQQSGQQLATHKAAITLGIIMGTFLFCWVPFFCLNITKAFCVDCIPSSVFRFFTWLGYANSALNPIIYGIHNSEFRNAFNRIFFKHLNIKNSRYYLNRRFSYDLRQQSAHDRHNNNNNNSHNQQKKSLTRKVRLQNSVYNEQRSVESKQSFKSCKAEELA